MNNIEQELSNIIDLHKKVAEAIGVGYVHFYDTFIEVTGEKFKEIPGEKVFVPSRGPYLSYKKEYGGVAFYTHKPKRVI